GGIILGLLAQVSNTPSVEGVVAKLGTGEPLARATVTLSKDRYTPQVRSTTTDASGRFSFLNVPPGEYRLQASRQGPYIPSEYGQRKPDERGTPITFQPGQKITEIRLELAPTSSISGRILDSDGEPLGRVEVQALQSLYQDGHRGLKPVQTVSNLYGRPDTGIGAPALQPFRAVRHRYPECGLKSSWSALAQAGFR